jgi:hypothetical protein
MWLMKLDYIILMLATLAPCIILLVFHNYNLFLSFVLVCIFCSSIHKHSDHIVLITWIHIYRSLPVTFFVIYMEFFCLLLLFCLSWRYFEHYITLLCYSPIMKIGYFLKHISILGSGCISFWKVSISCSFPEFSID